MADPSNRAAGSFSHTVGPIIRMAGCFSRTNKSFNRTDNSSSRPVFRQKYIKIDKNRAFSPFCSIQSSKSD
jgi:hypothetical protein